MKTFEKNEFRERNEPDYQYKYSLTENVIKKEQVQDYNFVVPWQMVKKTEKDVLVK